MQSISRAQGHGRYSTENLRSSHKAIGHTLNLHGLILHHLFKGEEIDIMPKLHGTEIHKEAPYTGMRGFSHKQKNPRDASLTY